MTHACGLTVDGGDCDGDCIPSNIDLLDDYLTLSETATELGLSPSTLRHQAQAGRLRAILIGKTYVVSVREVERYRDEHQGRSGRPRHATDHSIVGIGRAPTARSRSAASQTARPKA